MPPQNKTIQDFYNQLELDKLYAGKSSGEGSNLVRAMQSGRMLQSMPQGGGVQSLTPIGPLDFLAETAMTGASQMEDMNPLAMLLAGALAPGAYKKIKTTNTPALLKKYNIKVDTPLYHNTDEWGVSGILKTGGIGNIDEYKVKRFANKHRLKPGAKYREPEYVSLTRNPEMTEIPGTGPRNIQVILDKKEIAGTKPYVHGSKIETTKEGSPIFGKPSESFEAEERLFGKSIPSSKIKAIKVRHMGSESKRRRKEGIKSGLAIKEGEVGKYMTITSINNYNSFFKRAADKKIPLIIEPTAEKDFMGLIDIMNPKQKSKVLKNTKFAGKEDVLEDAPFARIKRTDKWANLENPVYEGVVKGEKIRIQRNAGASFDEWTEVTGSDFKIGRYLGSTKKEAIAKLNEGTLLERIKRGEFK